MNLILLTKKDFISDDHARLDDHRYQHIRHIHKAIIGDTVTVGLLNGKQGKATITALDCSTITLSTCLNQEPPSPLPLTLILALPRPKMLKRILQTCATMGVKKIVLLNSYRVEKSFWQTPLLKPASIQEQFILGLEQAKDTVLPELTIENRFKPFVEDRLPALCRDTEALVAHPNTKTPCPTSIKTETTLIIGPEGGFIPYEIEKFNQAGCRTVNIGERILRVETAVPVLLSKLFF